MPSLDHKIPPPLVALACAALAWWLARSTPALTLSIPWRWPIATVFVAIGVALGASGLFVFWQARTTFDPHRPDRAKAIVQRGPYRCTRNPMYLGLASVLVGGCVLLGNPLALLAVVIFIGYITRFQILPEERVLAAKFGEPWAHYVQRVRRWL